MNKRDQGELRPDLRDQHSTPSDEGSADRAPKPSAIERLGLNPQIDANQTPPAGINLTADDTWDDARGDAAWMDLQSLLVPPNPDDPPN